MKPTPATKGLHNLHLHWGIHFLMLSLNFSKFVISLYSLGSIVSHKTGPKYRNESFPINSVFTRGIKKVLSMLELLLRWNMSFMISGQRSFLTLNMSMATSWMFLWCTETVPFFNRRSWNDESKSLYTIRRALSCKWFILLFILRDGQNIHTRGQYENWDSMKEFIRIFFCSMVTILINLASAVTFAPAFLQMLWTWSLNFRSLFIVTPSNF